MNTMDVLTTVSTLTKNISNNLLTIADFQSKIINWDLLSDDDKPKETKTGKPIDLSDICEITEGITNETIALFETMSSMSKALFESIPEKEIVIYTQI